MKDTFGGIDSNLVAVGFTKQLGNGHEFTAGIEYDFGDRAIGTGPSAGDEMDTDFVVASFSYGRTF